MASTSPDLSRSAPQYPIEVLTGWGLTAATSARVAHSYCTDDLIRALDSVDRRGAIGRGLGRCYGDAAQNAGGLVVDASGAAEFHLDPDSGTVTASAGASIEHLIRGLVPHGFFVPVTPGTRYVTVGGAIAADVHGKNHHKSGSFSQHVASMRLALADGTVKEVSPDTDPDLFWATAGGMGLTGLILSAKFRCPRIETSRIVVDTERVPDLDHAIERIAASDLDHDYTVAWIDLTARGRHLGRSVLTSGWFAKADDLPAALRSRPLQYSAGIVAFAPPLFPSGVLNQLTVRAFNEFWFRKAPRQRNGEIQTIPQFFHPLDMVGTWNNMYGPRGFLQWQIVLPAGHDDTLRSIVEQISGAGCTSFLAVLKRFGASSPGHLSFPAPGWTLSLDIPVGSPTLGALLDRLDEQVVEAGGRIYLAKDSRTRAELMPAMYPRLDEWREIRAKADPTGVFQSDLSRRLGLT